MKQFRKIGTLIALIFLFLLSVSAAKVDLGGNVIKMGSDYSSLTPGENYSYFLLKSGSDPSDLSGIVYMDQGTADDSGTLSFAFIPSASGSVQTSLRGKENPAPQEVTWVLTDDGVLFITGNGVIGEASDQAPWEDNASDITAIQIDGSVSGISSNAFSDCWNADHITFLGDAPNLQENCFAGVSASVSFPSGNRSWTENIMKDYGGDLTWDKPHSHSFSAWKQTVKPGCETAGREERKCECGETETRTVAATGHQWDSGVVTVQPTEDEPGVKTLTCTVCGKTKTQSIPELNHTHQYEKEVISPTCTVDGYTRYTCSCGDTYTGDPVSATGHQWGDWTVTVPATGASEGEEMRQCTVCQQEETRTIPKLTHPFVDVAPGKFYETAVLWAVENGVTNGMDATHFKPNDKCTRAQVVTFLWRAAGAPEPTSANNPFADVVEGKFYYKAVLWAVEKGITNGIDATHFGTNDECTRGHVATFLWRTLNKPVPSSTDNPFVDVPAGKFYYDAVLWAVDAGVTNGMDATHFAPTSSCTRGQIVTFLYRALG